MSERPPRWADRFLQWYCNPELLEEIQGDAHELFYQRVGNEGKRRATLKFVWDVLRMFKWSNIRRADSFAGSSWSFAFTLAWRHARNSPMNFMVKILGISISFGYALTLGLIALDEWSYDRHQLNADRIYRVGSTIRFNGNTTHYAVSPLPLAYALRDRIPEIEESFRFMAEEYPLLTKEDKFFNGMRTLAVDSSYLKILTNDFKSGNRHALDAANSIVLTESLAERIFGDTDPVGQMLLYNNHFLVEVTGVLADAVHPSHLNAEALISWDTFDRQESWGNLNAYSYILVAKGSTIDDVKRKIHPALGDFNQLIAEEYKATFDPILENIRDIHLSPETDEDFAVKGSSTYVFLLAAIVVLFSILGIVNYVNLVSAELTRDSRKIGLLSIFGGSHLTYKRTVLSECLLYLFLAGIMTVGIVVANLNLATIYLGKEVDPSLPISTPFLAFAALLFALTLISTNFSTTLYLRLNSAVNTLKGNFHIRKAGLALRQVMVSVQFAFSIVMIALIMVLVRQFYFMQSKDKGFDSENVMVIKLHPQIIPQAEIFEEELLTISGVRQTASSSYYPGVIETKYLFAVESTEGMKKRLTPVIFSGADYLNIIGAQLTQGRKLEDNRTEDHMASYIINEAAAKEFNWKDPIGKRISGPVGANEESSREGLVVGVVKDFNFASLYKPIDPLIVILSGDNTFLYVKLEGKNVSSQVELIQGVFKKRWPDYPFEWEFLGEKYKSLYKRDLDSQYVLQAGMVISILVSCLGIFSISALMANLRQKEAGIRKVVGATSIQLTWLHVKGFSKLMLISLLISWPVIGYLSSSWLNGFAYRIDLGPAYYLLPAAMAALIVIATVSYHGIRSTRVNPVDVLKHE